MHPSTLLGDGCISLVTGPLGVLLSITVSFPDSRERGRTKTNARRLVWKVPEEGEHRLCLLFLMDAQPVTQLSAVNGSPKAIHSPAQEGKTERIRSW
jgi:hypothetical protein